MRIAIGCMMHESNTFSKVLTGNESFTLASGAAYRDIRRWKQTVVGGIQDTLEQAGVEVVPLFFARAIPNGVVRRDLYEEIRREMLRGLRPVRSLDGVCLALHGSMAVERIYDPEGDLLEAVRWEIGHEIPLTCALDMHATVTERMTTLSNGFSAYRTAPHIDEYETGARAARILLDILDSGRKAVNIFVKIPFLISGEQSETRVDPAKALFHSLAEIDTCPSVLCASYTMGFPWADSPFGGAGALVTGWADDTLALKATASAMARDFWDRRADFCFSSEALPPVAALIAARDAADVPVVLSDAGDNPTAGASQDRTGFLKTALDLGITGVLYSCIADPDAWDVCRRHDIGDTFPLSFGGYYSQSEPDKITLDVTIRARAVWDDVPCAALQIHGVTLILTGKRCAAFLPELPQSLGLELTDFRTIILKVGYLNAEYATISKRSILALTQGDTNLELWNLPYVKTPRPIYPLDKPEDF